jgi:hypothetical protein
MAGSKSKNIILGVVVVAVWGAIAYKIVSYFNKSNVVEIPSTNVFKTAGIKVKKDKFTVDASYRDPFLNEIKEKKVKPDPNSFDALQRAKQQVKWPEIKYNGIIETSSKDKKVGLMQIDKKVYLINEGDSTAKITVIRMYKDSLRLKFSNEVKVYPLQK